MARLRKKDIRLQLPVEAGDPYTEDFDQGKVLGFEDDEVLVAWEGSADKSWIPYQLLRRGHSDRWRAEDD